MEDLLNRTNEDYLRKGLAVIQKIPTPITPVRMDKEHHQITLAYFDQKSTIDYIGAVQGIPVCFDAKECAGTTFPLANIHEHQVQFMGAYESGGGVSFLLIYFTEKNICYYMRYKEMMSYWKRWENGGRRSFLFSELDEKYFLGIQGCFVPYLELLSRDLMEREQGSN